MIDDSKIPWEPLGREWWHDKGRQLGMTERQIAFSACKRSGTMSQKQAAILVGYSADDDRKATLAGSDMAKSKRVRQLIEAADVEERLRDMPDKPKQAITDEQLIARLQDVALGPDANLSVKAAIELLKINAPKNSLANSMDVGDGFDEWRIVRNFLRCAGGAVAVVATWTASQPHQPLANMPLLHDVVGFLNRDEPEYLALVRRKQNRVSLALLDERLANPQWQYQAREQLWREVGLSIQEVEAQASGKTSNGHAKHHADALQGGIEVRA